MCASRAISASGDFIYTSTNSGFDWAATSAPSNNWSSVVSSADGATLAAAANGDGIYFSTNFGSDWTESDAQIDDWSSIAGSADGEKMVAVGGDEIWISTNSGTAWIQATNVVSSGRLVAVASSSDGTKLVAVSGDGVVLPGGRRFGGIFYKSTDSGITWTTNAFNAGTIASSADGNKLIAGTSGGIYASTDSGTTWIQETNISAFILAFSADGNKSVVTTAVTDSLELPGGRTITTIIPGPIIYTSFSIPTPSINIAPTNGNLALSWLIPSTNFVLQQNFDLTTTNWTDMTNTPVLNLTNLQNQVFLPLPASNSFYRLATP